VPAPDIEGLIERFLIDRCREPRGDMRALVEAQVSRITVELNSIRVELAGSDNVEPGEPRQIVSLPWSKKPFHAAKGVDYRLSGLGSSLIPAQATLAAIGSARRWVGELMAGRTLAEIARDEEKGERYIRMLIPLAFVSPQTLKELLTGTAVATSATGLASTVSLAW
jgi:hypothetical protein